MPINIEMPKLSDTMTEGTVVRWLKKVGDQVEIGDEIAEIETDKATMAMEAFDEGTITEIKVDEGATAAIGATLAVLLEEGEEPGDDEAEGGEPVEEQSAPQSEAQSEAQEEPETKEEPEEKPAAESEASEEDEPFAPALEAAPEPEPKETPEKTPKEAPKSEPAKPAGDRGDQRVKASPLARKMAESHDLDLASLQGSGPGGRVVKKDVEAAMEKGGAAAASEPAKPEKQKSAPAPAQTQEKKTAPAPAPILPTASGDDQRIELSNLRRIIAERLLTSKTTIPHFYLHVEADVGSLMDIRQQVNEQAKATHGNKYTINDFILKSVINALQAVPAVNASFGGDHIVQFAQIGVAVAVAVDDGLVTPVVKDAARKSLLQISAEVKDLAARAREGKLLPSEFDGGTITVSNLGAYGIESFDAIINPPQAAILSVGAIAEKPVVVDGEVVVGRRMDLGLSCDHRVVDGAVGAEFLAQVKKLIENPALMLV